jgi:hypothetical protein
MRLSMRAIRSGTSLDCYTYILLVSASSVLSSAAIHYIATQVMSDFP